MVLALHGAGRGALLALIPVLAGAYAANADPGTPSTGQNIFHNVGCAACHGAQAQGTKHAPMLAGHTADQVKRYVRDPQGRMPRFGLEKLSDSELAAVASYIASLKAPEPALGARDLPGTPEMHHWMAHHALRANDAAHGLHHLGHALELAKDDEHRGRLERTVALTKSNRLEDAAHAVVLMLSDKVIPDTSIEQLHIRLALGSLDAGTKSEARHHLQHYAEGASGHDKRHAQDLLAILGKGDLAAVRTSLAHLIQH